MFKKLIFSLMFVLFVSVSLNTVKGQEEYTIKYYLDGTLYATEIVNEGEYAPNLEPTKTGTTFDKWYAIGGTAFNFGFGVYGDFNLYGRFNNDNNMNTIIFNPNGGSLGWGSGWVADSYGDFITGDRYPRLTGEDIDEPPAPFRSGYNFEFWYYLGGPSNNLPIEVNFDTYTMPSGGVTLYAQWEEIPPQLGDLDKPIFNVTYYDNNSITINVENPNNVNVSFSGAWEGVINSIMYNTFGSTINANSNQSYDIMGLDPDATYLIEGYFIDLTEPPEYENSPAESLNQVTKKNPISIHINYDSSRGTIEYPAEAYPGEPVTLEATPAEGYDFIRWYNFQGVLTSYDNPHIFNAPEHNLNFTAEFSDFTYPGFIQYIYNIDSQFTTYNIDPVEYFTFENLQHAIIFLNGDLVVEFGEVIDDRFTYVVTSSENKALQTATLREVTPPEIFIAGSVVFRYGTFDESALKGDVKQFLDFNHTGFTVPYELMLYLPEDSSLINIAPDMEDKDLIAPPGFAGTLDIFNLWTNEGLFIFALFSILFVAVGTLVLKLGSDTAILLVAIMVGLFVFMNLLPFWATLLLIFLLVYAGLSIIKGGVLT